jgi:hypothetical protein
MTLSNLPPADELAKIREDIRALGDREGELRSLLLTDPSARTGNAFVVEISEVESRRTDIKELRAMHPDLVDEYTFPTKTQRVELRAVSEDGEITPLRRKETTP